MPGYTKISSKGAHRNRDGATDGLRDTLIRALRVYLPFPRIDNSVNLGA